MRLKLNYLILAAIRDFQADKSCSSASLTAVDDIPPDDDDDDGTAETNSDVNLDDSGCGQLAEAATVAVAGADVAVGRGEVF